ncbi:recombinase family protein [Kluyvera sp. EC_51]|uniref:recombinase family protein n=1 Tax=Kluyvera sp. EC_51 TaxID=2584089 RepID=UPI00210732F3|nr:recombinase family protein [Kluyvera sp. EC_51]
MAFDLSSPYGRMLATFLSGIAEFERDLISERVKSGLAVVFLRTAVNDFMDSVHHIWCPLSSQEYQDLPDGAETTLTI